MNDPELTIEVVCARCEREMVVTFDYPTVDGEWVCERCASQPPSSGSGGRGARHVMESRDALVQRNLERAEHYLHHLVDHPDEIQEGETIVLGPEWDAADRPARAGRAAAGVLPLDQARLTIKRSHDGGRRARVLRALTRRPSGVATVKYVRHSGVSPW